MNEIKMKIMACAVTAMSLLAGAAQAGEWRLAAIGDGTAMFVDTSTIRNSPSGDKKFAWVAFVHSETNEDGLDYSLARSEYNCSEMTETQVSLVGYGPSDQILFSSSERLDVEAVIPDTNGYDIFRFVCDGSDVNPVSTVQEALAFYRLALTEGN